MRTIGLVAIVGMIVVGLIVCGRMLRLASKTRQLPEFSMGAGLLSIMVLGAPVSAISRMPDIFGTALGDALLIWGLAFSDLGIWLMYLFTWTVFRHDARWARNLVYALAVFLVVLSYKQLSLTLSGGTVEEIAMRTRPYGLTFVLLVASMFTWTGVESLRYYGQMRKRMAIGLADPVVVNRFFLWGLGGAIAVVMCMGLMVLISQGHNTMRHPLGQLQIGVGASAVAICWYLAFVPPRAYTAWVNSHAPQASA